MNVLNISFVLLAPSCVVYIRVDVSGRKLVQPTVGIHDGAFYFDQFWKWNRLRYIDGWKCLAHDLAFEFRFKRDIIFRNTRHLARNHSTSTYQHTNEKTTHTDIVARHIPENGRSNAFHQCASRRVVLSGNWWRSRSIIITLFNDVVWNGAVGDEPRVPMRSCEHHYYFTQGCFRFPFPHFVWE